MAYIGKQPLVGNFVKLDAITTSATTTFNLTNGGVAYYPQSANNCLVSLNGILQAPTDSYTISGSTIVFSNALTTSDVIDFIIVLGDVLNIGTPSDNTVSLAKLTATGTKDSTTFLRGDNTFAAAVSAGQVIQVVSANTTGSTATTSSSMVATGLSASITPSSTSNKILVMVLGGEGDTGGTNQVLNMSIYRNDTTNLGNGNNGTGTVYGTSSRLQTVMSTGVYDSPATTSSTSYKLYIRAGNGGTVTFNANAVTATMVLMEIKG
ncbi:hypothetical protein EB001_18465 [bacterium]|nr:hypothetical protein [bacterium]